MSHEPERHAAAYLGGVMRTRRRKRFEDHLLDCEDCWQEVATGRLGRRLAESTRELAPQSLRETIRAAVAAIPPPRRRLRWPLAGASMIVVLLATLAVVQMRSDQPAPIMRAVADFHEARMPSETAPETEAPDLSSAGLTLTSAAAGSLEGLHVNAFSYHDAQGRRVLLYLGDKVFPVAAGARQLTPGGPWRVRIGDLELLCSQYPHAMLAIGEDAALLDELAERLHIEGVPA